MKLSIGNFHIGHSGCSNRDIAKLESRFGVQLPGPYKRFLSRYGRDKNANSLLGGSDYFVPVLFKLRAWAEELLQEDGFPFQLHPQDFVILMHQGYQFFYFRADGANDDPPVFYYMEDSKKPEQKYGSVSDWLKKLEVYVA